MYVFKNIAFALSLFALFQSNALAFHCLRAERGSEVRYFRFSEEEIIDAYILQLQKKWEERKRPSQGSLRRLTQLLHSLQSRLLMDVGDYASSLIYLDRISAKTNLPPLASWEASTWIFLSITQWLKYADDYAHFNSDFIMPGGIVTLEQYHDLERRFLSKIEFQMGVAEGEYNRNLAALLSGATMHSFLSTPGTHLESVDFLHCYQNSTFR